VLCHVLLFYVKCARVFLLHLAKILFVLWLLLWVILWRLHVDYWVYVYWLMFVGNNSGPALRATRHETYLLKGLQNLSESYEVTICCCEVCSSLHVDCSRTALCNCTLLLLYKVAITACDCVHSTDPAYFQQVSLSVARSHWLFTSPLCRTSWYGGSSEQNSAWPTEFLHCSCSRLELTYGTAALCLH